MLLAPAELARRLTDADLVVVDCRFNLMQPDAAESAYRAGHIPGAYYAHLDRDLAGPKTSTSGRHPLPDPLSLIRLFSDWGVGPRTLVAAYDNAGGAIAARLWWLMRWMGHDHVALLDGGLQAWQAAGLPLTTEIPAPRRGEFRGQPGQMPIIEVMEIERRLHDSRFLLIDVRAQGRFLGQEEPIDPVAGHVPGAVNVPFQRLLGENGCFRTPPEIRALFEPVLGARGMHDVAAMCGSGVTACHALFALELAGIGGARLYPGSWSEWIRLGTRPVAGA
jgi:thiosulfate/3-mercaptopyruvate sulfurtransferase